MDNFIENKKIALFVVNLVSKMYHLDDAVLVEFHPASRFPNPEVTAMVAKDYRILYNINRLKVAPEYELYITSFHEMRHIYQYCCIDFGKKYPKVFNESKEDAKSEAVILSEIGYIKSSIDRIEKNLDKLEERYSVLSNKIVKVEEGVAQSHKRISEHINDMTKHTCGHHHE